jgi:hypothetical protein
MTAPTIVNCTENIVQDNDLGECGAIVTYDIPTFTDNCDDNLTLQRTGLASGSFFSVEGSPHTVTYVAIDDAGKISDACTFTITVLDTEGPVIADCPQNITVNTILTDCDQVVTWIPPFAITDNCDDDPETTETFIDPAGNTNSIIPQYTYDDDNPGLLPAGLQQAQFPVGTSIVRYTATDDEGNTTVCEFTVTVVDNVAPTAVCQDITVQVINGESVTITPSDVDGGSCDNCGCGNTTKSIDINEFDCEDVGSTIDVTLTVTDDAGNTDQCVAQVTVVEAANPTIVGCPIADIVLSADADCEAVVTYDAPSVATGCTSEAMTLVDGPASGTTLTAGFYTVTYEYDADGDILECSFNVTVEDNTAPTFDVFAYGQQVLDGGTITVSTTPGLCSGTAEWTVENMDDNCDTDLDMAMTSGSGNTFPVGCTKVTITVTDDAGNSTSLLFEVCVIDEEPPIVACDDITIELDAEGNASVEPFEVLDAINDDCGIASLELSQTDFTCDDLGENAETLTATDAAGQSAACVTNVTVLDLIDPVAVCKDITVALDENGQASITPSDVDGGSSDNTDCITLTIDVDGNYSCADLGANTVVLTITDDAGNSDNCTATVTIVDETNPVITCAGSIFERTADDNCKYEMGSNGFDATADDNCTVVSIINDYNETSTLNGAIFELGETVVTWTATDQSGNTDECQITIVVVDETAPFVTNCTADIEVSNDPGVCGAIVDYDTPEFDDNCDGALQLVRTAGPASGSFFPEGTTTISWVAIDDAGKVSETCTFTVTVNDDEAPVIADCPADIVANSTLNECDQDITWEPPFDIYDNCPGLISVTETLIDPAGNTNTIIAQYEYDFADPSKLPAGLQQAQFPVGISTVRYTATDEEGNSSVCEFTVTIVDNQAPTAVCPAPQILASTCPDATVPDYTGMIEVQDNCASTYNIVQYPAAGTALEDVPGLVVADGNSFTVSITVSDDFNPALTDDCSFEVTLQDFTQPIPDQDALADVYNTCSGVCIEAPTAQDECGGTIYGVPSFANSADCDGDNTYFYGIGVYNIVWIYDDGNGNIAQQTQSIVVVADEIAPEVECQDLVVVLDENGEGSITAAQATVSATDNCSAPEDMTYELSDYNFDCDDATGSAALVISGIIDGDVSAGQPKALELYVTADIDDLSAYGIGSANNGGGTDGEEWSFPADAASVGDYIYVVDANGTNQFQQFFGFAADYVATGFALSINGDDAVELFQEGEVIDVYGEISTDGTGEAWEYSDGWAYRNNDAGSNGGNFDINNWTVMDDGVDGADNNGDATEPFPTGTYSYNGTAGSVAVTLTVTDEVGNSTTCDFNVTVLDNTAPTVSCKPATVYLDANGEASIDVDDVLDTADDNCSVVSYELSQTDFDCGDLSCDGSSVTVTLTVADASGNEASCDAVVTVLDDIAPEAVCKPFLEVQLDEYGQASIVAADLDGGSTDNCTIVSMSASQTEFTCDDILFNTFGDEPMYSSFPVTLTVADECGNESECDVDVIVRDDIAPTIACSDDIESCCSFQAVSAEAVRQL